MSSKKTPRSISNHKTVTPSVNDLVDFGPETDEVEVTTDNTADRLRKLVKQLQEINRRIDNLSHRF